MRNYATFAQAVHAYAHGALIWCETRGELVQGYDWDLPQAGFQDPLERGKAARAIAHNLRNYMRYEDPEVKFVISWNVLK